MVETGEGLLRRIASAIRDDFWRLTDRVHALTSTDADAPGLYTYRVEENGGKLRLHLRVHADRTGLLFVNATQTVHLSPTEVVLARLALDETPAGRVMACLQLYYPDAPTDELMRHYNRIASAVATLRVPTSDCLICQLGLPQPPPFAVRAQAPYKADLALQYACNNACTHCYNEPGRKHMPSLSLENWRKVLRSLFDIGVPYIIFTGGEPSIHPHIVELVAHAEMLGQITGMNTNGRRLADRGLCQSLRDAGLDHVQVTLNSHRREVHNQIVGAAAFDETVQGIREALDVGLHTLTNSTLLRSNVDEALNLVDFLHDLGVGTMAMNGMIYSGCGARHEDALDETQLRKILPRVLERVAAYDMRFLWYTPTRYCRMNPVEMSLGIRCCNAAEYSICVEPNGDVLPCQSYYEPAGNILTDPWEAIWESDLFHSFRDRREDPAACGLPEECHECEHLSVCGGGCTLERNKSMCGGVGH